MLALDHVQLAMPEGAEDLARAFWSDLVGLTEIEKPAALKARGGVWFRLAGTELHLGVERPFRPAAKAHPGFRCTALDELAGALAAAGYEVNWDNAIAGRRRFFCADPFGNRLEFLDED
ncbi:VOC family protein [Chachezhania sediminis]|uniref:VOC family protein n=1 Tax=Chachezhania sediminis TaxID=2599291 RepID=UPI0018EEE35F|nr:VOC family protein [Chachezhania sediminis]